MDVEQISDAAPMAIAIALTGERQSVCQKSELLILICDCTKSLRDLSSTHVRNIDYRPVFIDGPTIDDTGVQFRAERAGKLIATGVALHDGHGQADTIRRALRDLRVDHHKRIKGE